MHSRLKKNARRAVFACFASIVQDWGSKKEVLIYLVPPTTPPFLWSNRKKGKLDLRRPVGWVQSSLTMTCQTMRWLRSALVRKGCSFKVGSSTSLASPSSSPAEKQRQVHLNSLCHRAPGCATVQKLTHPEVNVAFSPAHHQHGPASSFLNWTGVVSRRLPSTGRWGICMTWQQKHTECKTSRTEIQNLHYRDIDDCLFRLLCFW